MEMTAFTHEEQMQIYLVSNIGQPARDGSPYCKLCEVLTTQFLNVQDRHVTKFYQGCGFELLQDLSPGGLEGG